MFRLDATRITDRSFDFDIWRILRLDSSPHFGSYLLLLLVFDFDFLVTSVHIEGQDTVTLYPTC